MRAGAHNHYLIYMIWYSVRCLESYGRACVKYIDPELVFLHIFIVFNQDASCLHRCHSTVINYVLSNKGV